MTNTRIDGNLIFDIQAVERSFKFQHILGGNGAILRAKNAQHGLSIYQWPQQIGVGDHGTIIDNGQGQVLRLAHAEL